MTDDLDALLSAGVKQGRPFQIDKVEGLGDYVRSHVLAYVDAAGPLTEIKWRTLSKLAKARFDGAPTDYRAYQRWCHRRIGEHVG